MRNIYSLIVMLVAFVSGLYIGADMPTEREKFVTIEQYKPQYIGFSDDEMLNLCEQRNLIYDYESGLCTLV